ncbi:hypothetical protein [Chryseobacterium sp. JV558]|uniref:hypothetical protein n=1 Tax=Chryseobacterium sp. JV558 TaxID=2663236 RepID=UPI00299DBA54|nr:hypothetical protein [Chryseobacterium sp. JV558]MDW9378609.1 hypothetical protein [Chryseobacterium sp. JV558]
MKARKVFGTETTDYLESFQYTDSVLKFLNKNGAGLKEIGTGVFYKRSKTSVWDF